MTMQEAMKIARWIMRDAAKESKRFRSAGWSLQQWVIDNAGMDAKRFRAKGWTLKNIADVIIQGNNPVLNAYVASYMNMNR